MQLDRARELLGVGAEFGRRELKRAYLRAVKAHPPERDAEGFARVREAYDALKGWARPDHPLPAPGGTLAAPSRPAPPPEESTGEEGEAFAATEGSLPSEPTADSVAPGESTDGDPDHAASDGAVVEVASDSELVTDGDAASDGEPGDDMGGEPLAEDAPPDPLGFEPLPNGPSFAYQAPAYTPPPWEEDVELLALFEVAGRRVEGDTEAVLAAARELYRRCPDEVEAFWLLYDALLDAGQLDEAVEHLREGHGRGVEGCFEELARLRPESLDAEEFRAHAVGRARNLLAATLTQLLSKRPGLAVWLFEQALDEAERDGVPFWAGFAADVVLQLSAQGKRVEARELFERYRRCEARLGPSRIDPENVRWLFAAELVALPLDVPERFHRELARACQLLGTDREGMAGVELMALSEERPYEVPRVREALALHAPGLFGTFGGDLPARQRAPAAGGRGRLARTSSPPRFGWAAAIGVLALLRLCGQVATSPGTSHQVSLPTLPAYPSPRGLGSLPPGRRFATLPLVMAEICARRSSLCVKTAELREAWRQGDCGRAQAVLQELEHDPVYRLSAGAVDSMMVDREVRELCRAARPGAVSPDGGMDAGSPDGGPSDGADPETVPDDPNLDVLRPRRQAGSP